MVLYRLKMKITISRLCRLVNFIIIVGLVIFLQILYWKQKTINELSEEIAKVKNNSGALPYLCLADKKLIFTIIHDSLKGIRKQKYHPVILDKYNHWVVVSFYHDGKLLGYKGRRLENLVKSLQLAVEDITRTADLRGLDFNSLDIRVDFLGNWVYQESRDLVTINLNYKPGLTGVWIGNENTCGIALPKDKATLVDLLRSACLHGGLDENAWESSLFKLFFFETITVNKKSYSSQIF